MDQRVMDLKMAQAAQWIKDQSASGLSKSKWCEENGINRVTFFRYQRRLREIALDSNPQVEQRAMEAVSGPVFVELPMQPSADSPKNDLSENDNATRTAGPLVTFRCGPFSAEVPGDLNEQTMSCILQAMKNAQ